MSTSALIFIIIGICWCADKFIDIVEWIGTPNHKH